MTNPLCLIGAVLLFVPFARAQEFQKAEPAERPQPSGAVRSAIITIPRGVAREFKLSARDLVTFRDPPWSALTLTQIGAATADAVSSVNNLDHCPTCFESGPSRIVVGERPDLHKYIIAGIVEVGAEAVTAHYFRRREPPQRWYWRTLWSLPQSLSLFEHARAAKHNMNAN